jgi:DNA topoisomerase-3
MKLTKLYVAEKASVGKALANMLPGAKKKEKERTKSLFSGLKKLIRGLAPSNVIVNVGDGDREGQTLVDEILEHCGWQGQTKRLRLNDVNPDAIWKALPNMKNNAEYRGEYEAGKTRMYADWLVGTFDAPLCHGQSEGSGV